MARPVTSDFLQSMRFHVTAEQIGNYTPLRPEGRADAGFSAVTIPELSIEATEYKEGRDIYTRKYAGIPSVSEVSLSRGVGRQGSAFMTWARIAAEGSVGEISGEYRADIQIKHYHRQETLPREFPALGTANATELDLNAPARIYHCRECFPVRFKPAGDLDGTSAEISIQELDLTLEHFEIEEGLATAG